jgi:hypothetical protein
MAYNFTSASSQRLSIASTPVTATPLTMSAWFRRATISANTALVCLSQPAAPAHILSLRSNLQVGAGSFDGNFAQSLSGTTVSQDVWTHGAGVWASTTSRTAYQNGVAGTTNTSSINPTVDRIGIGALNRTSPAEFFNGDIAEVGIWNAALTAAEIASLADGMTCDKVRPQSLVFYAPLVRDLIDYKGGLTITNNNTATVANHPRVYA